MTDGFLTVLILSEALENFSCWKVSRLAKYSTFLSLNPPHIFQTLCMLLKCLYILSLLLFSMSFPDHVYSSWTQRVNWLHVVMETHLRSCIASPVMKTDRPMWRKCCVMDLYPHCWAVFILRGALLSYFPWCLYVGWEAKITHCTLLLYKKTAVPRYTWRQVQYDTVCSLSCHRRSAVSFLLETDIKWLILKHFVTFTLHKT